VHPCTFVGAPEVGHIAHSGKVDTSYVDFLQMLDVKLGPTQLWLIARSGRQIEHFGSHVEVLCKIA